MQPQNGDRPSISKHEAVSLDPKCQGAPSRKPYPEVDAKDIKPELGRSILDPHGIHRRLVGYADLKVELDSPIRNVAVTRDFMSTTYGGSPRAFYPAIPDAKRALLRHNHHFLFPNLMRNPHAPRQPGQVGLLCRSGDVAPWGDRTMKVLVRLKHNRWWYIGDYQTVQATPLSREEFECLPRLVGRFAAA